MKNLKILFLLFSVGILCGCSGEKKFSLENPSMLVERANQYIQEGELSKKPENSDIIIPGALQLKDFDFAGIMYSLSHDYGVVRYVTKKGEKKDDTDRVNHDLFLLQVDKSGKCRIAQTGSAFGPKHNWKLDGMERAIEKASKYIADGNISKKAIEKKLPPDTENDYFKGVIRSRIPEKIKVEDMILMDIRNAETKSGININYCLKATLLEKGYGRISFNAITINVDEKGQCSFDSGEVSFYHGDYFQKSPDMNQNELENIYETVFRYMFKNISNRRYEINMRFLNIYDQKSFSEDFFERFKDEKIPVRTPLKKHDDYRPDLFDEKYKPNGKDALFYSIDGIKKFDETHVFVECSIIWNSSVGKGYIYTLEKEDRKWKVIKVEKTWKL